MNPNVLYFRTSPEVKNMFIENNSLRLVSKSLGALPIVNHFLERLQIERLFIQRLPVPDSRVAIPPVVVLMTLLRSLILCRMPLYSVSEWAGSMVPEALGLDAASTRQKQ